MLSHPLPVKVRLVLFQFFLVASFCLLGILSIVLKTWFRRLIKHRVEKAKAPAAHYSYQLAVIAVVSVYLLGSTFIVHQLELAIRWTAMLVARWVSG